MTKPFRTLAAALCVLPLAAPGLAALSPTSGSDPTATVMIKTLTDIAGGEGTEYFNLRVIVNDDRVAASMLAVRAHINDAWWLAPAQ